MNDEDQECQGSSEVNEIDCDKLEKLVCPGTASYGKGWEMTAGVGTCDMSVKRRGGVVGNVCVVERRGRDLHDGPGTLAGYHNSRLL